MGVLKLKSGRWQAVHRVGRAFAGSATFNTKKQAEDWLAGEKVKVRSGIDPRAGKVRVRNLLGDWIATREIRVAPKTARADRELLRLVSPALGALFVSMVEKRNVQDWFDYLRSKGLSRASIVRHRASLSAFFAWCIDEGRVVSNPVSASRVPPQLEERVEMKPFSLDELEEVYRACCEFRPELADIVLVAGWTGLRWGELRAVRVADVMQVPHMAIRVCRSQPEGNSVKVTKGRRSRSVPVADRVRPIVEDRCQSASVDDLLFTGVDGGQLWRTAFLRLIHWKKTGRGRRIHDLRHTAACLWLSLGVDPGTVQAWMGHESIATTNRYIHYLGTSADKAGLALLNQYGCNEGAMKTERTDARVEG